jgi:hypothetical protein
MGLFRKAPVERLRSGRYRINIDPQERAALARLVDELRTVVASADPDDLRVRRLHPTAVPDDPEADAEYQRLMRDELVQSRLAGADTVITALGHDDMSESELYATMQAVNSLRLVLGTLLDVGEDDDADDLLDTDGEPMPEMHLYHYLSWILDAIVQVLADGL